MAKGTGWSRASYGGRTAGGERAAPRDLSPGRSNGHVPNDHFPVIARAGPEALRAKPRASSSAAVKRLLDAAVAGAALLLLSPLIVILALAIEIESPGPVFFRCRRVGRGGRKFLMLKFRKMRAAATGPALTATEDERFTRLGRFLARTRLDEIPQLWNVVVGDMSLVGPRPEDPSFVALRAADFQGILQVRPGITGLTQLAFLRESELLDAGDPVGDYVRRLLPQKIEIDRLYVARQSVAMDLRILGWTALAVLARREVAVHRSTGRITFRRRPSNEVPEPLPVEAAAEVAP
jgi:lipopolysaccharide/colanic/teichoic acid biosynthesis glycosyltransferase